MVGNGGTPSCELTNNTPLLLPCSVLAVFFFFKFVFSTCHCLSFSAFPSLGILLYNPAISQFLVERCLEFSEKERKRERERDNK